MTTLEKLPDAVRECIQSCAGTQVNQSVDVRFPEGVGETLVSRFRRVEDMYTHDDDGAPEMLVIGDDALGNHICIHLVDRSIYFWDHELNLFIQISDTIWEFLRRLKKEKQTGFQALVSSGSLRDVSHYFGVDPQELRNRRHGDYGRLLMEHAVIEGNQCLVEEMAKYGFESGKSLEYAARNNRIELARKLLDIGADVDDIDLTLAERLGYIEVVDLIKRTRKRRSM